MSKILAPMFVDLLNLCKKLVRRVLKKGWAVLRFCLPIRLFLVVRYMRKQRRVPNLVHPVVFTEKVLCKILFDRNELYQLLPSLTHFGDSQTG